ncbi:ferredoxin [Oscillospiraceae bacterium 38-13]
MTVSVDSRRCIACGMCAYTAPEVFQVVGTASVAAAQPGEGPGGLDGRVRDAVNGCPVNAILLTP